MLIFLYLEVKEIMVIIEVIIEDLVVVIEVDLEVVIEVVIEVDLVVIHLIKEVDFKEKNLKERFLTFN